MSMESKPAQDNAALSSLLGTLPGVNTNDPRIQEMLKKDEKKDDKKKDAGKK